jgi:hypothetical protein
MYWDILVICYDFLVLNWSLLLRPIWIINFYVKYLSDNLSQGHKKVFYNSGGQVVVIASSNEEPCHRQQRLLFFQKVGLPPCFPPFTYAPVSNEKKTLVYLVKWYFFGILIHVLSWNIYFRYWEKKNWKSTIIWWNNWTHIIWQSRRTWLMFLNKLPKHFHHW